MHLELILQIQEHLKPSISVLGLIDRQLQGQQQHLNLLGQLEQLINSMLPLQRYIKIQDLNIILQHTRKIRGNFIVFILLGIVI